MQIGNSTSVPRSEWVFVVLVRRTDRTAYHSRNPARQHWYGRHPDHPNRLTYKAFGNCGEMTRSRFFGTMVAQTRTFLGGGDQRPGAPFDQGRTARGHDLARRTSDGR